MGASGQELRLLYTRDRLGVGTMAVIQAAAPGWHL